MKRVVPLLLALLMACESTPSTTELLVVVDSNLQALSALHVELRERTGERALATHDFSLASDTLPLSFSLYPLGDADTLRLVVVGRQGARDVVEQQVSARFVREQRRLLSVFLHASCEDMLCRDGDRTCSLGTCVQVPEAELRPVGAGPLGGYESDAEVAEQPSADIEDAAVAEPVGCAGDEACTAMLGRVEPAGCALGRCRDGACSFEVVDADGDGDRTRTCRATGMQLQPGGDCDDGNRAVSSLEWDGPASEQRPDRCDELDNDCNGKVDDARFEGASCVCNPARDRDVACSLREDGSEIVWPAGAPVGACKAGSRSCVEGAWGPCDGAVTPLANDSCTTPNDDSNCNGVRGENCQCTDGETRACGIDTGSCESGVQTCTSGRWSSACTGAITAEPADTCDLGNDANCNGTTNDGCKCVNGTTSTCGAVLPALGDCLNRSVTCVNGDWPAATCSAQCDDCPADEPCSPGSCIDGPNTFSCDCPSQYNGDGTQSCQPQITICPGAGLGMDAGPGVACGPHTRCLNTADGGTGCACDFGYEPIPNSDPPTCKAAFGN
ncbi:MAG: hypothetical protein ABW352_20335 [Polyangiales bacterium]